MKTRKSRRGDKSFQPSAAGKGDADRTSNIEDYRQNYDEIDWGRGLARFVIRDGVTFSDPHPMRFDFAINRPSEQ